MVYHMLMPRKQVLVQLDDELVRRLDRLAHLLEVSRSELLRRGALAVLEAARLEEAERALVAAYQRRPQDPALVAAARRLAAETVPGW
jgi:predicted transcriptional regulator